jgi:hypothetical protein
MKREAALPDGLPNNKVTVLIWDSAPPLRWESVVGEALRADLVLTAAERRDQSEIAGLGHASQRDFLSGRRARGLRTRSPLVHSKAASLSSSSARAGTRQYYEKLRVGGPRIFFYKPFEGLPDKPGRVGHFVGHGDF